MRRRDFIKAVAGSAAAWPLAARAQQTGKIARVGVLASSRDNPITGQGYQTMLVELRKLGSQKGRIS